jgi:hypothetical protein
MRLNDPRQYLGPAKMSGRELRNYFFFGFALASYFGLSSRTPRK